VSDNDYKDVVIVPKVGSSNAAHYKYTKNY
jgi:hypothetical protein